MKRRTLLVGMVSVLLQASPALAETAPDPVTPVPGDETSEAPESEPRERPENPMIVILGDSNDASVGAGGEFLEEGPRVIVEARYSGIGGEKVRFFVVSAAVGLEGVESGDQLTYVDVQITPFAVTKAGFMFRAADVRLERDLELGLDRSVRLSVVGLELPGNQYGRMREGENIYDYMNVSLDLLGVQMTQFEGLEMDRELVYGSFTWGMYASSYIWGEKFGVRATPFEVGMAFGQKTQRMDFKSEIAVLLGRATEVFLGYRYRSWEREGEDTSRSSGRVYIGVSSKLR